MAIDMARADIISRIVADRAILSPGAMPPAAAGSGAA
jgi:hypothetical protein